MAANPVSTSEAIEIRKGPSAMQPEPTVTSSFAPSRS
jgi:hypothetical protein